MATNYNDPLGGTASTIGSQARTDYYHKKALIAVRDKQYFMPLANVRAMPKHMGKKIKQDVYIPLLDDRNVNDQGLSAAGAVIADGNLYGSSKDTGVIGTKIPTLTENGGRVNRVGFTRLQIEGDIHKRGFFTEYTQESLDFDSDAELLSHITEEALVGANEEDGADIQAELYLSVVLDRKLEMPLIMASTEGGMILKMLQKILQKKL
jgi:N4-gp56 family major capsid protein